VLAQKPVAAPAARLAVEEERAVRLVVKVEKEVGHQGVAAVHQEAAPVVEVVLPEGYLLCSAGWAPYRPPRKAREEVRSPPEGKSPGCALAGRPSEIEEAIPELRPPVDSPHLTHLTVPAKETLVD